MDEKVQSFGPTYGSPTKIEQTFKEIGKGVGNRERRRDRRKGE